MRLLGLIVFLLCVPCVMGQSQVPLRVEEVDGNPSRLMPARLIFPNNSLTVTGANVVVTFPPPSAPSNAEYLVGASDSTLTAERVVTDTPTIAWDLATAGQAKVNVVAGSIGTSHLADGAVTFIKLQNLSASRVIGRQSGTGGSPQELSLVAPLEISGTNIQLNTSALLDNNARVTVRKNSGTDVGTRRRLNFIEGSGVTINITDDATDEELDITVSSTGGGGGGSPAGSGSELQYRVDSTTFGAVSGSSVSGPNVTLGGMLTSVNTTTDTGVIGNVLDLQRSSTGTPANGFGAAIRFGLESSTTDNRDAAQIAAYWRTATDSSRTAALRFLTVTSGFSPETLFDAYYETTSTGIRGLWHDSGTVGLGVLSGGTIANTFAVSGSDIIATMNSGAPFTIDTRNDGGTNNVIGYLRLQRNSTGTTAAGFGVGMDFFLRAQTTDGRHAARIAAVWNTATDASRSADIAFFTVHNAGALTERMRLAGAGNLLLGATAAGGSATNTLGIAAGTAPADSPSGLVQVYATDVGGTAQLFARNSGNAIARLTGISAYKTANQNVTNSTTLVDATDLSLSVEANRRYAFRAVLHFNCGATSGARVAVAAPTGNIIYQVIFSNPTTGAAAAGGRATASGTAVGTSGATGYYVVIEGSISTTAAGTLKVQFAQQTADGTATTLLAGSTFEIQQLG